MNNQKNQYWKGQTMMGLVEPTVAEEIKMNARNSGKKVYDNGHFFTVEG